MNYKAFLWPDAPTLPAWASAASGPVSLTATPSPVALTPAKPGGEVSLELLASQEEAVIVGLARRRSGGQGRCCLKRLQAMGLRPGVAVRMLHNPGCGLVLLQVNGTRLALGRNLAANLLVRRKG